MNWAEKAWNYFTNRKTLQHPLEEELDVPRHKWVNPAEIGTYLGKRVEVPVVDDRFGGETNVVGRLTQIEYYSLDDLTVLTISGPTFVANVDIYPEMKIMVHL
jgi:hypothetical protein